jgi:hypothetical protein
VLGLQNRFLGYIGYAEILLILQEAIIELLKASEDL